MAILKKDMINEEELGSVTGGSNAVGASAADPIQPTMTYKTRVTTGYLALRSEPSASITNEIGRLNNDSVVYVLNVFGDYAYVIVNYSAPGTYTPVTAGTEGYCNKNFLY